jgi:hypothetical protein
MKRLHFQFFVCLMLLTVLFSCEEILSECGEQSSDDYDAYGSFFKKPADIYWGVTSGVRSYTYNYEFGNICTKQNPKVSFTMALNHPNFGSNNPISVKAGVYTCLGVQAQQATMTPDADQIFYRGGPSEIGMTQCFSGKSSATIYPYITVSFNTLGSSHDDSLYFLKEVLMLEAKIIYNVPK